MDFELKSLELAALPKTKSDALIILVPSAFKPASDAASNLIDGATRGKDFEPRAGKVLFAYRPAGFESPRVVLAGIGEGQPKQVKQAVQAACVALKGAPAKQLHLCFAGPADGPAVRAAMTAAAEATYIYTSTKSKPEGRKISRVTVGVPDVSAARAGFDQGKGLVLGVEMAKEWANRPANHATPTQLAESARKMASAHGLQCEILGPREVGRLGMGSFMAVARGSEEPLRFIVLRYEGAPKSEAPVVLVGKGITFDTGGISIKPAAEMDEMKFDMSGAASVLGAFRALAELRPALNVVGLIAACENMPDGRAVKPGDVVTSMSGQTIEILNTDAEGRLVLCDALTYAERFKPRAVVDIATLTGACVVALGAVRSGMFSPDDELAQKLAAAGESSLDACWRLPLDDDYAEGLKTNFADVANVGGRAGGAVTAAKFLQRFATAYPWAHLDIAGSAWKGGTAKGATGRPVGLLVDYLMAEAKTDTSKSRPNPRRAARGRKLA